MEVRKIRNRIGALLLALIVLLAGIADSTVYTVAAPTDNNTSTGYADIDQFPESYQASLVELKQKHPSWTFVPMVTNLDWQVAVNGEMVGEKSLVYKTFPDWAKKAPTGQANWYLATEDAVKQQMDPRNSLTEDTIFQFEQLTYNAEYHTMDAVKLFLESTFMNGSKPAPGMDTMTFAECFWWIGQEAGREVSPFHLAARVLQEQGQGNSPLISGTYAGYEGYYNYFNVNASGSTNAAVIKNGLQYAKDHGWNNAYLSIMGGADLLASKYIKKGQDTLYLEKYNVNPAGSYALFTHQYMQNISAPSTEAKSIKKLYEAAGALDSPFVFKIPVYLNMPEEPCGAPQTTTSVKLTTTWEDDGNRDGVRPESVKVNLLTTYKDASGQTVSEVKGTATLSEANGWTAEFKDLPRTKDGEVIPYSFEKVGVSGYTGTYSGSADAGYVLTLTHESEKTSVTAEVKWEDGENADGVRPESLTVSVLAEADRNVDISTGQNVDETPLIPTTEKVTVGSIVLNEANNWKASLGELKAKNNGKEIDYLLGEVTAEGYTFEVTGDGVQGYTITGTHTSSVVSIPVELKWEDEEDKDGIRPASLIVNINDGTEKVGSLELKADGQWKGTLEDLPAKKDGKDITYVLEDVTVEGYTFAVTGDGVQGYTITGTHETAQPPAESLDITVTLPEGYTKDSLWLDGVEYKGSLTESQMTVTASDKNVQTVTAYKYNASDVPVGMYVWLLTYEDGAYKVTAVPGLEDVLTYHGFSIRISGNSGIRFKTGISEATKTKLTGEGVDGMTLSEYGTLVMNNANRGTYPFLLNAAKVKGSMSYGQNGGTLQDIVFETVDGRQRFTSVLVGLPAEQYKTEFAFRGYIILQKGEQKITFYGPPVARSIYSLADRLIQQNYYSAGSSEQLFLEKIISDADAISEENQ